MRYWFTSDYHLGHANIIDYCKRPFKTLEEMEEVIIRNHNDRVKPEDTVFFIGDFYFKNSSGGKKGEGELIKADEYIKKLNGKFVFILGNHDKNNSLKTCLRSAVIKLGGEEIFLVHDPINFNKNYRINLVGHVHEKWKIQFENDMNNICINVGCDQWGFKPINIQEILNVVVSAYKGKGEENE